MNALLVDVGNSRIKWRIDDLSTPPSLVLDRDASASNDALPLGDTSRFAETLGRIDRAVETAFVSNVASVQALASVEAALIARWPAIRVETIVSSPSRAGVVNDYVEPARLGPDRWLAMIGAHALATDAPLLICTFGTATTIDLLVPDRDPRTTRAGATVARFVGGLILPGFEAMRDALFNRTARLPAGNGMVVDFATSTADAIASGIVAAQLGAIERAIRQARWRLRRTDASTTSKASPTRDPLCLIAGGAAPLIAPHLDESCIEHRSVPDLVLRGLAVVARDESLDYHPRADAI